MVLWKIQKVEIIQLAKIPCEPWGLAVSAHVALLLQIA